MDILIELMYDVFDLQIKGYILASLMV